MDICDYENIVDDVLHKLHIDQNRKGYTYVKIAIIYQYRDYHQDLRPIFRVIGLKYGVTYSAVETAIKRCIKDGIRKCPSQSKIEVFGYDIEENNICGRNYYTPTEFINHVMHYIHKLSKK